MESHSPASPAAYAAFLWIGRVVLLVMIAAVLWAGYLAVANWSYISV